MSLAQIKKELKAQKKADPPPPIIQRNRENKKFRSNIEKDMRKDIDELREKLGLPKLDDSLKKLKQEASSND